MAYTHTIQQVPVIDLTTSFAVIYGVPSSTLFTVGLLHIVNTTGSSVSVSVCVVPVSATGADQTNALLWNFIMPGYSFLELACGDVWDADSNLEAMASAGSSINIKLSGIETTGSP